MSRLQRLWLECLRLAAVAAFFGFLLAVLSLVATRGSS
jgi:hypothetical protein